MLSGWRSKIQTHKANIASIFKSNKSLAWGCRDDKYKQQRKNVDTSHSCHEY